MVAPRVCGIALSPTRVAAASASGPGAPWQRELSTLDGTQWPALAQALRDGVAAGAISSPVRMALLPPLVEMRTVSIPPVSDEDARRLLTRAASRHFVSAREPMEVGVVSSTSGGARLAAAVPVRVLRAILDAARDAQLDVEVVVPAQVALVNTAQRARTASGAQLVAFDESAELLVVRQGTLADVRRFRRAGDEDAIAEATRAIGDVARIADPLGASAAAMVAAAADRWPMVLNGTRAETARSIRPHAPSWWLFGAAAVLALGTVALQEWDVRRELEAVRTERAALAPQLTALGAAGTDGEQQRASLRGPMWSGVLAALGDALPADAFVTHLRTHSDTVVLEGNAARASAAFDALSAAPWVRTISATAPIRRETTDDGSVTEKFEFTLTLRER